MRLEEFREPSHGAIPGPSRSRSAGAPFGSAGYPWDREDWGAFSRGVDLPHYYQAGFSARDAAVTAATTETTSVLN